MSETPDIAAPLAPDIRPVVGRAASTRGLWLFGAAAVLGGGTLFAPLESHRATLQEPSITAPSAGAGGGMIAQPPDLFIPPPYPQAPAAGFVPAPQTVAPIATPIVAVRQPTVRVASPTRGAPPYSSGSANPPDTQFGAAGPENGRGSATGPQVVFDAGRNPRAPSADERSVAKGGDAKGDERVMATRFANPATTIPKGTVVQAVLETALDSTRAGLARAIVSRDVYGFDGTRVLVPKGSRLIGEYKSDIAAGQSRALIQWQRLMRPDGVLVNLDSPSADPLGRAGVKGKVNTHFLARFSSAFMQSALQVGSQVAINKLSDGTAIYAAPGLYALPGALQGNSGTAGANVQPTLTVRQGTSVSVFVAKDLDFTSVE